ncbi:NAD(P)-dependent alcohol dehydrogenase [Aeromicrobium stalagmiti]|uniref:NAD(P)-dependent alcohol dehydrogenase n=1 Tax=Aeromicrobium stalagmiti TaxID=2738988 RepID=UPI001569DAC7|nr:NAD(P)-dependent alcohol dehydrogenase [Aeromicrobium stalagmiti]NRQ49979.1 NAD(P)-dependent alcohol dehydrogenase [Aeromicrobium stalagmiti]
MTTTARAAVIRATDAEFTFEDIVLDDITPSEILVRIVATGLCHTDLAVVHGHIPGTFPLVLGHEGAGIVEQVGSSVTDFVVGDHVAASFASCGHCANCLTGREAYCLNFMLLNIAGVREDGSTTIQTPAGETVHGSFFGQSSFATHAIVSARNAVKIPEDVPLEIVGPLGCGIQTGAGTVLNSLAVPAGSSIIVSGTGAVGLSAIMAAKVAGATTIIAVDVLDERLAFAQKLGATHVVNGSTTDDVVATIMGITDGLGADYAVDTTAVPTVIENAINATRFGASIALVGVGKPDAVLPLALVTGAGKTLVGAIEGDAVPQVFIPQMLQLYRAGLFPFDELITTYAFDDIDQAIADTQSGAAVKAVLTMA